MSSTTRRSSASPFRSRRTHPPPHKPSPGHVTPTSSAAVLLPKQQAPRHPTTAPPGKAKENVTVTVRFRPLSAREISKGDEVAWYADGDHTVRNEFNSDIEYDFDRVFGPATTTRQVYDVAAHHAVSGAMQGINGTVFAYGVTSSGKTHTMHGEQKSPGIIPLAIKDVFGMIQETPGREFLLRVSYLEIYNEVINDLLDPTGQNLRIREDSQGIYVEGIKEEVVLSPAHALSLIASGEEHRHVGSNNFNLLSSRSHTIFTLTIESSVHGENEGVALSQLHLIDLAGSESSKTGTIGLRRKEGSYINKSLLTLGTVISKLTDGKSTHIPYRDSKLTRLLQSSLSGHGRVSAKPHDLDLTTSNSTSSGHRANDLTTSPSTSPSRPRPRPRLHLHDRTPSGEFHLRLSHFTTSPSRLFMTSPESEIRFGLGFLHFIVELGVLSWRSDADNYEIDPELKRIREARGYSYMDFGEVCPEKMRY
ncbi:P-loop containing nucleoside triphosphate hydrolases superfamily protein [Striga hermonthica]|uniref:Kinesin-like protein n=1 Tax=Striga hermonthica TaxID=68872 RepID=A0A9N7NJU4_STRHE|nr:P-loop containing nucleoside triphosphate hydrolases superfamily protein [Striga hermonthica]